MQNDRPCQASQQTFEPLALLPRPIQYQRVSFQARCLTPEHKRTVLPTISQYSEGLTSNPSTAPCLFQYKSPGRPSVRSVTKTSAPSAIAMTRSGRRGDVWLSDRTHLNDVELDHQSVSILRECTQRISTTFSYSWHNQRVNVPFTSLWSRHRLEYSKATEFPVPVFRLW